MTGPQEPLFPNVRLHVVTGKGGTGKTTVAAALAIALAAEGRRTLLIEVEDRQGISQLFDTPPLPYEERRVAVAPRGGEVLALAVDPQEALLDYLEMFYNLRRAGAALSKLGAVEFATTIAPGVRDILLTGKAVEAVKRREAGRAVFDAVVMDAPPTGRITRFLNVNSEVAGIARVGPIHNQANSVMAVLRSPRTAIHAVTLLEEMPVQETIDGIAELREQRLPVGAVLVNMTRKTGLEPQQLAAAAAGALDAEAIARAVVQAEVLSPRHARSSDEVVAALVAEAADIAIRDELQRSQLAELAAVDRPLLEIPWIAGAIDLGALYEIAEVLTAGGLGHGTRQAAGT